MRFTRAVLAGLAVAASAASAAQAASPERSVSDRLQDRRYLVSGERAYATGFEDGRWYANGWHITGEMGGIWTPPLKLADGVWFGVGDQWVGPSTNFTSGWGYTRMDLPDTDGFKLRRTDFAMDGGRAVLFGLELRNTSGAARTAKVKVDAHSELMRAYPWGSTTPSQAEDNQPDTGAYQNGRLVFRDRGYAALVGSNRAAASGEIGPGHRGDQGDAVCVPPAAGEPEDKRPPSACDDGPYGKGTGGQLRYDVRVPARGTETVWIAVAGSDKGLADARKQLDAAVADPGKALARKTAAREKTGSWTRLSLPGDRRLQEGIDWGKQNLADATQAAEDLQLRLVEEGKQYPPPVGTVKHVRFVGAGWPDYPWLFATDGEYTSFAGVALGQFEPAMDHMRALRDISEIANEHSGKVVHEVVTDGSIYFGSNQSAGNTDETVKFPSIVALLWRWTGDNRFRDEMYDFSVRNLRYAAANLDADGDGWLEGLGNVERSGMGPEKLDNNVYYVRGLYDLADMARSKGDRRTARWATRKADDLASRFESEWWVNRESLHADSLGEDDEKIEQKHWITSTPMDAELTKGGKAVPGLASYGHGTRSLALHETPCFSGTAPDNQGLFHTGCGGGPDGKGELQIFSLNTAIQAVGEGNYGRLGAGQQKRYTDANVEPMLSEPATNGTPDEMPGAMPEILPSPAFGKNIDRCWTCRSMFLQAWGNMGTAWPVVHQQLGVRPDMGRGRLEVVPQVPGATPIAGSNIRLGKGALKLVQASHDGRRYVTTVDTGALKVARLRVGHTLARNAKVDRVTVDGRRVGWEQRKTNRGLEVTAKVRPGRHTVGVTTR